MNVHVQALESVGVDRCVYEPEGRVLRIHYADGRIVQVQNARVAHPGAPQHTLRYAARRAGVPSC